MEYLLLPLSILVSFLSVIIFLPVWIRKCRNAGLVWEDMNKIGRPKNAASSGGVIVVMSFILGLFLYLALKTFVFDGTVHALEIFSLMTVVLILGVVGLVDDLLGWHNKGLPINIRLFLALFAAIPLVIINAGVPSVTLPFFGVVNLGLLYPLVLIPLGIVGATTTFNFLAGMNGLEAGQGIILLSFLSFAAYYTGSPWLAIVGLCMVAALMGFYVFNRFPAQVFPGDILTYAIGALIAGMAILGNFEKVALIVFIPNMLEVFLKLRGGLKKYSFGLPKRDGSLTVPYDKFYSLNHIAIFLLAKVNRASEKNVAYLIHAFTILFVLLGLAVL